MSDALTRRKSRDIEIRSPKNRVLAFLMAFFFGYLGLHRFYTGKFWTGLFQFFTAGGLGVWWIIDCVMILLGRFKDGEGRVLGPPRRRQLESKKPSRRLESASSRASAPASKANADDDPDLDDLLADPLEDEFAQLEEEMNQKKAS